MNVVVYCHGYGSSPDSAKVSYLRETFDRVIAVSLDIDPDVAMASLEEAYLDYCLEDPHSEDSVVVVGTSLGAWHAARFALKYDKRAILINPSYDPSFSLAKYGVSEEMLEKYSPLIAPERSEFYFAEEDEVIPNENYRIMFKALGFPVTVVPNASHRFDGEHFAKTMEEVICR
tara:strand:+ start:540 stop:1061 length:522 start_codon:yes stop_codon:yes gene_type:complete